MRKVNLKVKSLQASVYLLILLVMKLILGFAFIDTFPIDLDEPFTIYHSQKSLTSLFDIFWYENNPPLHFLILHFWEKIWGINAISVRSLSLIFSVLTLWMVFITANKFLNLRTAIIASLILIFSSFHHYIGIEARHYALLIFEFSCLIYIILKLRFGVSKNQEIKHYVLLALFNLCLFYTHYIFLLILFSEVIVMIILWQHLNLKRMLLSVFIFILGTAPWISILMHRFYQSKGTTWLEKTQFSQLYGYFNLYFNDKLVVLILILVCGVLSVIYFKEYLKLLTERKFTLILLLVLGLVPYFLAFILSYFFEIGLFYDKYLLFCSLPVFIIFAYLLSISKSLVRVGTLMLMSAMILNFNFVPQTNRDGDKIAEYVKTLKPDAILIAPDFYDKTFLYHYDQNVFRCKDFAKCKPENMLSVSKDELLIPNVDKLVYVDADYEFTSKDNRVMQLLLQNYRLVSSKSFKGNYKVIKFHSKK